MDDAIGWCGFSSSKRDPSNTKQFIISPWNGYTVQVNTALSKSVAVGSLLKLEAKMIKKEGQRKHWIEAKLVDPITGELYSKGEGLFLLNNEEV
jgi:hypothetical protein